MPSSPIVTPADSNTELLAYLDGLETDEEEISHEQRAAKLHVAVQILIKAKSQKAGFDNAISALGPAERARVDRCLAATKHDIRRLLGIQVSSSAGSGSGSQGPDADTVSFVQYNASRMKQNHAILKESLTKDLLPLRSFQDLDCKEIPGFPKNGQAVLEIGLEEANKVLWHLGKEPQGNLQRARALVMERVGRP